MNTLFATIAAITMAALSLPVAMGQGSATSNPNMKVKVTLQKLELNMRQSPDIKTQDDPKGLPKPKTWADMEIGFKVEAAPPPKSGFIDALTFKFYIAVLNPDRAKQYLKLTKTIQYVNIPVGEPLYASVYLSPSSVKRITGSDRSRFKCEYEGVVVEYNGKEVASFSNQKGKKKEWWKIASPHIVETSYYPLLNKDETPFSIFWYDRYPEIMRPLNNSSSASAPAPAPSLPAGNANDAE